MLFSCYLHFIYIFVVYPTKLSVTQIIQRRNKYVNHELEMIWKKLSWPNIRHYHCICHKGLKKTTKNFRITGLLAEI
jgi:hypothetical protein